VRAFWEKLVSLEIERKEGGKAVLTKMGVAGATAGLYKGLHIRPRRANPRPRVWMDISIGGKHAGRIIFELFAEALPRTCRNFRALCTGEMGISPRTGKPLCYRGSPFHRAVNTDDDAPQYLREGADGTGRNFEIWKGMFVQGGDIEHGDGTGSESIYGPAFEDEGFEFKHNDKYLLSMAGTPPMRRREAEARAHVPHRNGSQFFITTKSTTQNLGGASITHFDYRHVVFGRVASREGIGVVNRIQKLPTDAAQGHRIREAVVITDCGEVEVEGEDEEQAKEKEQAEEGGVEEESLRGKTWFELEAEKEAEEERARKAAAEERGVPEIDREDEVRSAEVDD
jgi:cyclophilin family peptidyl-prolyl cis-trans isomerase